jgi:acyl CoA:acetate/3-ketoacid CoA transferase alpha subunit
MNKVVENADVAIADVFDGATLMVGGFGLSGLPENCIAALVKKKPMNLTCISNNAETKASEENDQQLCGRKCRV